MKRTFRTTRPVIRLLLWCALSLSLPLPYANGTTSGIEAPNWGRMAYDLGRLHRLVRKESPKMSHASFEDFGTSIQPPGQHQSFRCVLKSRLFFRAMIKRSDQLMNCCLDGFQHSFNHLVSKKSSIMDTWESDVTKAVRELMKQGDAAFAHLQGEHIAAWMQKPEAQRNDGPPSLGAIDTTITSNFAKYVTLHWRNKLNQAPKPERESLPFIFGLPKCRKTVSQLIPPTFGVVRRLSEDPEGEASAPGMVQKLVTLAHTSASIFFDTSSTLSVWTTTYQMTNPVCRAIEFVWARVLGAYAALAPAFDDFIKTQPTVIVEEMNKLRLRVEKREDRIDKIYKKVDKNPHLEQLTEEEKEDLRIGKKKLHEDKLRIVAETRKAKEMVENQLQSKFRVESLPYGMSGRYVCSAMNWILQRFVNTMVLNTEGDMLHDVH